MKKTLTIKRVQALEGSRLRLAWSNGVTATVDLGEAIGRSKSLAALKDAALFAKATVGDWGHSVRWTDDLELGAESLWRRTLEAIGRPGVAAFIDWRLRHGLSLTQAAHELGLSRRMVAYYEAGTREVPKTVLLACHGWEARKGKAAQAPTHRPQSARIR